MHTPELIRILIIDDDEDDYVITEQMIMDIPNGKFQIHWCPRHSDAMQLISSKAYDIYFIDYFLGGITGMELLKKSISFNQDAPMILLTGKGNRDISLEALNAGAADYLIKSELNTEKLERCIRYALENASTLKQLRDNESKFRAIFEQTRDAIFLSDTALNLLDVNSAMEKMLGFSADEMKSLSLFELLADELKLTMVKDQLCLSGEVTDLEIGFHHQSGEEITCIFSAITVARPDGVRYIQGILHDITGLKRAERSLLMSEKLAATGRLARTLAHEIRNPLTSINLSLDHLKGIEAQEDQKSYFEIIKRNTKRINDILSELLASARPENTRMEKNILQKIIDDSVNSAMDRIMLKHIKLQVRYIEKPIVIQADPDKLKIAFLNIIINAIEAMEDGKGRLMIVLEDDEQAWEVKITDNGIGISEEDLPRLFEPYFTVKRNGLGLGLSATFNILQAHNAVVEVTSVPNVGTTFSIQFAKMIENIST
jgi:PAS domain S-box-containing protein